jgi:hypothetical protein
VKANGKQRRLKAMTFTIAGNCVTVILDGKVSVIHAENQLFEQLLTALRSGAEDLVSQLVDKAKRIRKHCTGKFDVDESGAIYADGTPMPYTLAVHIIKFADAGADVAPLLAFWINLKVNPSEVAKQCLYDFLSVNHVPITEDGKFLAYKRVDKNYMDIRTHTFDNSVGSYVSEDRALINPDPNVTCARGLHVAAFNYADKQYGGAAGEHLIEVLVDPADVVAVPTDYNQQKMRVCAYEVNRECEGTERADLIVTEEKGKNYRTHYLKNYKRPCKSMTLEDVTSHKPAKAGVYACVRAATREEAYRKFMVQVS